MADSPVAVVTGGSGGIGQAILRAFAQQGVRAVSLDLKPATAGLASVKCDVKDDASVEQALVRVHKKYERLDYLVHAAGISRDAVVWKLEPKEWDRILNVNLRGAFFLVRHAIPLMRKDGGRVVLIGSINGSRGKFGTAAYSASKAGLIGLAKTVARETGKFKICVNVVEPGWVRTPLTEAVPKEIRDAAAKESLLGRLLEPEEIAHAVMYLCGPGGAAVTGQIIRVDGGQCLSS